jgi:hypothetical protein
MTPFQILRIEWLYSMFGKKNGVALNFCLVGKCECSYNMDVKHC